MAEGGSSAGPSTLTETQTENISTSPAVRLKLKKPKTNKKVQWTERTVDNEFMNKKKSKCCCIYEKPKLFGESSSESDDEDCDHCRGHKKKDFKADRDEPDKEHGAHLAVE